MKNEEIDNEIINQIAEEIYERMKNFDSVKNRKPDFIEHIKSADRLFNSLPVDLINSKKYIDAYDQGIDLITEGAKILAKINIEDPDKADI